MNKNNYIDKVNHIKYTFKHVICINKLAIKYKVWSPKYLCHDVDKLFMYAFCFNKDVHEIHNIHRIKSSHHVENMEIKKKMDWTMAVLDWESARFTKPDKPLNAYQTLIKYYPQCYDYCYPIIKKLKLPLN